ncbi:MAG: 50S ribosomal protein L3 [Spirochaetia bacterium]|nr:50S ribosomal protein L3 [Spirochaetia bacterium]MBR4436158.1 50S ribosomal protein L3 [Spirochaetales bacterium]MBR4796999.1 50S ribosomal protein L3 [Spirochaetia bacterium]MBR5016514.1 50S ribosomal protein L3 [Spirochaetia bacterium]MBR5916322.1 50S ribosomal protein L3 [Spirochaetia bacterium]
MIGLIAEKVGMTQVFDESGVLTPVTVIKVDENTVVGERTAEKNGYSAVVLGYGDIKKKHMTKPYAGQFAEGIEPRKKLVEFRDFELECKPGDKLGIEVFTDIDTVDVIGTSKGKGYAGVMKRHNFGGGRATHGSKFHRQNGGVGMSSTPGKLMKGLKMAGRMGSDRVTVQNIKVVKVDAEKKVILIAGAVPGAAKSLVLVRKAIK